MKMRSLLVLTAGFFLSQILLGSLASAQEVGGPPPPPEPVKTPAVKKTPEAKAAKNKAPVKKHASKKHAAAKPAPKAKVTATKPKTVVPPKAKETPGPGAGNTKPLSDFELARYQYCGDDRDCTIVVNGCCDCANGGQEVAISRDRVEAFKKRFECLYAQCEHRPAVPPCKNGVVSCLDHKCKYFDDTIRQ